MMGKNKLSSDYTTVEQYSEICEDAGHPLTEEEKQLLIQFHIWLSEMGYLW